MKKAIALKLLKSPTARKTVFKALKNKKVRDTVTKQVSRQVSRRVFGK